MMLLLSPAKTLDYSEVSVTQHTEPRLQSETLKLIDVLQTKDRSDLKSLMSISDKLTELNYQRFKAFSREYNTDNSKQALLAFKGDVYTGLKAEDFTPEDLQYAQAHLRILSGLYGVLRPLDLMQAYRLEMGTRLQTDKGKNLYEFWGNQITDQLNKDLLESGDTAVLNLASKEYFSAVNTDELNAEVINVHFKEYRGDKLKVISFNAKKARGAMAREVVRKRITTTEELKSLKVEDYIFNDEGSSDQDLLFTK